MEVYFSIVLGFHHSDVSSLFWTLIFNAEILIIVFGDQATLSVGHIEMQNIDNIKYHSMLIKYLRYRTDSHII